MDGWRSIFCSQQFCWYVDEKRFVCRTMPMTQNYCVLIHPYEGNKITKCLPPWWEPALCLFCIHTEPEISHCPRLTRFIRCCMVLFRGLFKCWLKIFTHRWIWLNYTVKYVSLSVIIVLVAFIISFVNILHTWQELLRVCGSPKVRSQFVKRE